jgi:hypothetical protein
VCVCACVRACVVSESTALLARHMHVHLLSKEYALTLPVFRAACGLEDLAGMVKGIAGLHPQSPYQFTGQPSARVSQTLRPSYLSHVIAAAT